MLHWCRFGFVSYSICTHAHTVTKCRETRTHTHTHMHSLYTFFVRMYIGAHCFAVLCANLLYILCLTLCLPFTYYACACGICCYFQLQTFHLEIFTAGSERSTDCGGRTIDGRFGATLSGCSVTYKRQLQICQIVVLQI